MNDIQNISVEKIKPNPWQPRTVIDANAITELAESISAQGLLQPPMARAVDGHYELAFGHRRLLAWRQARPGEPMPLQVRELSDREMAECTARENADREDLNPVERAVALKRLIDDFKMTQTEAGRLFGLATQGAVSNAMRLLRLPADVQLLLATGQIAERHARALLPLYYTDGPDRMSTIAARLVKLDDGERDDALEEDIYGMVLKTGNILNNAPWELDWPINPIHIDHPNAGDPGEVPACKGCKYKCLVKKREFCLRPACHAVKFHLFAMDETEKISGKLGIAMASGGEKVTLLCEKEKDHYDYSTQEKYKALIRIKAAAEYLRLVPAEKCDNAYYRREITGSSVVMLGTVNQAALDRLQPTNKKKKVASSYAQKEKEREQSAKECKRLALAAAPYFVNVFPSDATLLGMFMERFAGNDQSRSKDMENFELADNKDKRLILARLVILVAVPHWTFSINATPEKAIKKITDLAEALKVKLPAGWDVKPDAPAKKSAVKKAK